MDVYEVIEAELSLTWKEKRQLKKVIKKLRKILSEAKDSVDEARGVFKKAGEKEEVEVDKMREDTILAILSLRPDVFESITDKKGNEVTAEMLSEWSLVELIELFEECVDGLENVLKGRSVSE